MTEKEKFFEWFNAQRKLGMQSFKPWFNIRGIAEHFGATVKRREGLEDDVLVFDVNPSIGTHYIDFGDNHPGQDVLDDYIYGELNKVVAVLKNGTPFTFYDSFTPSDRLRSLARTLEDAARDGKDVVSVGDAKQAAEDIYDLVGRSNEPPPFKVPKINVRDFVEEQRESGDDPQTVIARMRANG